MSLRSFCEISEIWPTWRLSLCSVIGNGGAEAQSFFLATKAQKHKIAQKIFFCRRGTDLPAGKLDLQAGTQRFFFANVSAKVFLAVSFGLLGAMPWAVRRSAPCSVASGLKPDATEHGAERRGRTRDKSQETSKRLGCSNYRIFAPDLNRKT